MRKSLMSELIRCFFLFHIILMSASVFAQDSYPMLQEGFKNPPEAARPRTWWHWTNGNVTKEGITKDLEWMKRSGIGGFQLADVAFGMGQKIENPMFFGTPEWLDAVRHSAEEAKRLGLEMSIFSSAGWSLTGGPWVKPEQAMKKLVWSQTTVEGPVNFTGTLPVPPSNNGPIRDMNRGTSPNSDESPTCYRDQRVIAFPTPVDEKNNWTNKPLMVSHMGPVDGRALLDGDLNTALKITSDQEEGPAWIQYIYEEAVTIRSISLASPGGIPVGRLLSSDDGVQFHSLLSLPGTQNYRAGKVRTFTIPETTAKYFRLELTESAPSPAEVIAQTPLKYPNAFTLTECILNSSSRIHRWEDKAGFSILFEYGSSPTPPVPLTSVIDQQQVVDLTNKMDENGILSWSFPEGNWTIMRFGYSLTGAKNRPAVQSGLGYEVDKLNEDHTSSYMEGYLGPIKKSLGPLLGESLQYLLLDSWEAGMQNWTDDMIEEFADRRGYDPLPFLPALAGYVVTGAEVSDRFLWDFRRTLVDMFAENHYGTITEIAHKQGLGTYSEASGVSLEVMEDALLNKKHVDIPMGEFWVTDLHPSIMYHVDIRGAASASHVYGKNIVAAEAYTGGNFESPVTLKRIGDYWFTQGVNRFVFHTSAHQPLDTKPGNTMVGTHLHRNITWAEQAGPFLDYIARTSYMLQQGHFVADLAYLLDEGAPSTMPFWGSGINPSPPDGYDYDYINTDVLLNRMNVDSKGNLILPGGMSYKVLIMPGNFHMTLPVLRKIRELVQGGATILGPRIIASPSLTGYPEEEKEIFEISEELWGDLNGINRTIRYVDKGLVAWGESLPNLLKRLEVAQDVSYTMDLDAKYSWIHRKVEDLDIYFISNQTDCERDVKFRFRIENKAAEFWYPNEGTCEPASFDCRDGSTTVPLHLPEYGSVFVVFHDSAEIHSRSLPKPHKKLLAELDGIWELTFLPGPGSPGSVELDSLVSWTDFTNPLIKFFSGSAVYSRNFKVPGNWMNNGIGITLDLGEVRDVAEVKINGISLPALWKKPYCADVTSFIKKGSNSLEITVTNQWTNRLAGDQYLPEDKRTLDGFIRKFFGEYNVNPSGLLGPVKFIAIEKY